jgi:twitching motility protein PilT
VIAQTLCRRVGGGRVAAHEVLIVTPAVRDMIADGKRIGEIRDYIAEGRDQYGMQTFDQHLADLVQSGEVTFDTAMAAATNPSDFELKMRMFRRVSEGTSRMTGEMETVPAPEPAVAGVNGMTAGAGGFEFYQQ